MYRYRTWEYSLTDAQRIEDFYQKVLKQFEDNMEKAFRYKPNVSEDHIEELIKIVKSKLNNKSGKNAKLNANLNFEKYQRDRPTNEPQQFDYVKYQAEIKLKQLESPKSIKIQQKQAKEEPVKQEPATDKKDEDQESQNDLDALQRQGYFDNSILKGTPVKVQQTNSYYNTETPKKQVYEKDSQDEIEQKVTNSYNQSIKQMIGFALVGTFSSFRVRRKAKEQKIFIQLQNVFMKSFNTNEQNYFLKLNCELQKIEKYDILQLKKY